MYRKGFIGILLAPMGVLAHRSAKYMTLCNMNSIVVRSSIEKKVIIHQPLIFTAQLNLKLELKN